MPPGGSPGRERAVTVQIGAVILFGFLIVALSTYQATVVPDQNREVEFLHNQEVQTDMVELSSSVAATGRTGDAAPATVSLGTRYPSRAFLVNPPPASGTLRTVPPPGDGNVTLDGVEVVSTDPDVDTGATDFWEDDRNYTTGFIRYEPQYGLYREAPTTTHEPGVTYNEFPSGRTLNLTTQRLVSGDRISLVLVRGDLDRNGVSTISVNPEAVSRIDRRERVDGNMNITIPTERSAAAWRGPDLLDVANNEFVDGVTDAGDGRVRIRLNDSKTYALGIAVVDVGGDDSADPEPAYIDVERAPSTMNSGSVREVTVEVRDRYGNPVAGHPVRAAATDGSFTRGEIRSDEDGIAVFEYEAEDTGEATLNVTTTDADPASGGFEPTAPRNATVNVTVTASGGGGGGGGTAASLPSEIVFEGNSGSNENDVSSIPAGDGPLTDYNSDNPGSVGPKEADLDADAALEIPYVDSALNIQIIDANGNESVIWSDPSFGAYAKSLSVGDVDDDSAVEVLFIGDNNDLLRQVDYTDGGTSTVVQAGGSDITAAYVAGVGDFNGDDDEDIVFVGTDNNEIKYIDNDAVISTGVVRNVDALGQPADIDADGDLEVPYVTSEGNINYVDADGTVGTAYSLGRATIAPLASVPDQDGNGADEVVFVDSNNEKLYSVDAVARTTTDLGEKAVGETGAA